MLTFYLLFSMPVCSRNCLHGSIYDSRQITDVHGPFYGLLVNLCRAVCSPVKGDAHRIHFNRSSPASLQTLMLHTGMVGGSHTHTPGVPGLVCVCSFMFVGPLLTTTYVVILANSAPDQMEPLDNALVCGFYCVQHNHLVTRQMLAFDF